MEGPGRALAYVCRCANAVSETISGPSGPGGVLLKCTGAEWLGLGCKINQQQEWREDRV